MYNSYETLQKHLLHKTVDSKYRYGDSPSPKLDPPAKNPNIVFTKKKLNLTISCVFEGGIFLKTIPPVMETYGNLCLKGISTGIYAPHLYNEDGEPEGFEASTRHSDIPTSGKKTGERSKI